VLQQTKTGSLRSVMPGVAGIVDDLRREFGADLVDRCIARGRKLEREHRRILAVLGQAEADRWLAREQAKGAWFGASEGGRTVGVMTVGGAQ
jgi:hypothetical protein